MKPTLACCTPRMIPYPSGFRWTHSAGCHFSPSQKVRAHDLTPGLEARLTHPAGADHATQTKATLLVWMQHPSGCLCSECALIDFWLDRDDDDTEVWLDRDDDDTEVWV